MNTLSPGVVGNEFTEKTMDPKVKIKALDLMLIKRFARVEEMVGGAIFLASDASSFVTGAILPMDGGNLALNAGGTYPGSPRVYA